ncbi:Cation transporting ATPase [Trichoderma simmonsii]|uniref:Cation transporting ATPase n=1 Tax=Trichoderma simmonsii TaxID=1491479 RepID=A0A8G0LRR0_9HYPO|nr:Cation transporting ATPase [Trichoderma simmonsii]
MSSFTASQESTILPVLSPKTVFSCQDTSIVVHMLTSDHPQTVRAIITDMSILTSPERMCMLPADVARITTTAAQEFDALGDSQIDVLPQLHLVI